MHLRFDGINVSVRSCGRSSRRSPAAALTVASIVASKLHAILGRGTRRDFFDLDVTLLRHRLGLVACLRAIREVYRRDANDGLLPGALTYFDDADREAPLPNKGELFQWGVIVGLPPTSPPLGRG